MIAIKTQMQRMPERCEVCQHFRSPVLGCKFGTPFCIVSRTRVDPYERPNWCQLVEVADGNID